jgi:hypothetical protein
MSNPALEVADLNLALAPAKARGTLERDLECDPARAVVGTQLRDITRSGLPLP